MHSSATSLLRELWPELDCDEYKSFDFELSPEDKEMVSAVFTERKCRCVLCGRADFENFSFSFTAIKKTPLSIHTFCPCGCRVGTISKASLSEKPTPIKKPLPITIHEFLLLASENPHNKGKKI